MNYKNDSNYVSVGSWMGMMFVTAIPVIGLIMTLVWAFTGENETRKNYFRAILMWFVVGIVLVVGVIAVMALVGGVTGGPKAGPPTNM